MSHCWIPRILKHLAVISILTVVIAALSCPATAGPTGQKSQTNGVDASPDQIKNRLHSILNQPDFHPVTTESGDDAQSIKKYADTLRNRWSKLTDWLERQWEWIKKLFGGSAMAVGESSQAFIVIFVIACAGLAIWYFTKHFRNRSQPVVKSLATKVDETESDRDDLLEALSHSPEDWAEVARNYEIENSYRKAIRAQFMRAISFLDQSGLVEYRKFDTGAIYLKRASAVAQSRRTPFNLPLNRLFASYEYFWYGEHEPNSQIYRECAQHCDEAIRIISARASSSMSMPIEPRPA